MALDILHDNWGPYTHTEVENALKAYLTVLEGRINQAIQEGGVGLTDLSQEVQALLNKANTALQPENIAAWAKAQNKPGYTVSEITGVEGFQNLLAKLQDMDVKIQAAAASGGVDPDDEMSSTSENVVQNKVIKAYVDAAVLTLQNALNVLMNGQNVTDAIDTFNEVVTFLNGIDTDDPTLSNQLLALNNAITALQTALAGKISGIKANGASTTLPVDQNGIVELPPAGSTISPATATPSMDGTAAVGSSAKYAREDHVHPHDSTKANVIDVYTKTQTDTLLSGKQSKLTFDDVPTAGHTTQVMSSDKIKTALDTLLQNLTIGQNGNWYVGQTDTGVKAQGPQGQKGNSVVDGDSFLVVNNLIDGGDVDALSADMGIVLKRNIGILNDNMQAMMTALANLAFSTSRPTLAQLDWTSLTHSVTLVTTGLSHCRASADDKVAHGGNLVITLSPDSGYVLDGVVPTVSASNGSVSTAVSGDNILITVANVAADVTVTISATAVPAPLSLHLSLSHCSCSSHTDGQTIAQGSTINVVLNTDTNYTLSQNDIAVTGGTAQVAISNNGATATISIMVNGDVTVSAEAVFSLEYVNDGLVFHLDGSDTGGANDNQWVDKIGGIVFKKPTDSVITKLLNSKGQQIGWDIPSSGNGRYFAVMDGDTWNNDTDGSKVMTNLVTENGKTHFIIGTGSGSAIGTSACTIEAVFKQADASQKFFVCMFSTQASSATSANAPYMVQDKSYGFYGLVSKFWSHAPTTVKQTVSMSTARAYANGSAMTAGTAPSKKSSTNEGGVFIGATRGSGYTNPTNQNECYLYAVRIYNRILDENEVKHNQYVDNVLYGLGLNLTDVSLNNG